jgi:outer membrane protein OmpA-like peptidoglycan-associated protein
MIATASYDGSVKLWKDKKEPPLEDIPLAVVDEPKKEEPKKDVLKDIKIEEIKEGDIIQLENILFRQSRPDLLPSSQDELDKLISFMKKYPTVEIELSGHTDNVGNPNLNQKLSEQRVVVVKNNLIRNGVNESRIQTVAYGGSKPLADNRTEAGRQKNRRVEMKILKK